MKKESSYQEMKRLHREEIAGIMTDLRILVADDPPFVQYIETKERWKFCFQVEDTVLFGDLSLSHGS